MQDMILPWTEAQFTLRSKLFLIFHLQEIYTGTNVCFNIKFTLGGYYTDEISPALLTCPASNFFLDLCCISHSSV